MNQDLPRRSDSGVLYGVGVGPGDPELLTLKAHRLIQAAPVIAYPAPDKGESFARRIVAPYLDSQGKIEIVIRMPMLTERFPAQEVYDQAHDELGSHLRAGRDVVVLCQGDPFFYGSFMYLYARMCEEFRVEVVPGVSSLVAGGAALGSALASRNDMLIILPGPVDREILKSRLCAVDSAVIIKVGRHFRKVREVLDELGLLSKSRYIERATLENQRILALDEVDPEEVPYFSMILMHKRGWAWKT